MDWWEENNKHYRGFLPHFDGPNRIVFITYRLADSLPEHVIEALDSRLRDKYEGNGKVQPIRSALVPRALESERDRERRRFIEKYLDAGHGSCLLKRPEVAEIVRQAWHFFDLNRYRLISYVIMGNHIHILIELAPNEDLAKIIHSWKSFTSHEVAKLLKDDPAYHQAFPDHKLWYWDYWDRLIRDEKHGQKVINYILSNPIKAGLCKNWHDWPYTWLSQDFMY